MSTKYTYKIATTNDVSIISTLAKRIWKKHYISIISMKQINYMLAKMYSSDSLLKQMKDGHEFTLVYLKEIPLGYISLSTKNKKDYFLHKFYVEVSDQGKGIGTNMFTHVLKKLKGAKTIELTVNRENFKAINFYFKNGFKIKAIADFDIGNSYFMNDFVMVKKCK